MSVFAPVSGPGGRSAPNARYRGGVRHVGRFDHGQGANVGGARLKTTCTDGSYTKATRAHTHRKLIREWLWKPNTHTHTESAKERMWEVRD